MTLRRSINAGTVVVPEVRNIAQYPRSPQRCRRSLRCSTKPNPRMINVHMQARTLYMPSHCRMVCSSSAALEIVCTLQPHRERIAGQSSNPKRVLQRPLLTSPCHFLLLALKVEAITRQVFSPHLDHGDELFPGGPEKAKALRKVRKRKDKCLTVIVRSPLADSSRAADICRKASIMRSFCSRRR